MILKYSILFALSTSYINTKIFLKIHHSAIIRNTRAIIFHTCKAHCCIEIRFCSNHWGKSEVHEVTCQPVTDTEPNSLGSILAALWLGSRNWNSHGLSKNFLIAGIEPNCSKHSVLWSPQDCLVNALILRWRLGLFWWRWVICCLHRMMSFIVIP